MPDRFSRRVYRALLYLFPRDFRELRGAEMERMFSDMCAEWEEEGRGLGLRFWMSLVLDTMIEALGEWFSLVHDTIGSARTRNIGEHMSALFGDVRYAVRQLIRQPLFSGMVVVLMALGIAGNAAVFRVFNGLFLRPLPFDNPEQLVDLDETAPQWDLDYLSVAYRDYALWRDNNSTFQSMMVYGFGGGNYTGEGEPQRISYLTATHTIDEVLGLVPLMGRFFGPEEDHPDGPRAMLLTEGFWQREYGSDPDVIGRTVNINGSPIEIIGVLPPAARFMADVDVWLPLRQIETNFRGWGLNGIGRLKADVTIEQARSDLMTIHKGAIEQWEVNEISAPVIASLRERFLGSFRLGGGFLLGAVGIVLLIACANIAGLMMARSMSRAPEMAVRLAMGAPRGRIIRQLLTESMVLAGIGATVGVALGVWGSNALVTPLADQFPSFISFDLDMRFVGFTLAVTMGAAVLFGFVPALQASATRSAAATANRSTTSGRQRRAMNWLVSGEVAMALALLVVGGLSMLDVYRLGRVDPGFDSDGVISYRLALPAARYPDRPERLAFADDYLARVGAIPGIEAVALASSVPLSGHQGFFLMVDGAPPRAEEESNPVVLNRTVTPGYFQALGIEFAAGRPFDGVDGREGNEAMIVNETFVRTHLSHMSDPVGARLTMGTEAADDDDTRYTVVGVTRDVKHYGLDEEMRPGIYQPFQQSPRGGFQVVVRLRGEATPVMSAARAVTAEMDVELPVYGMRTMTERLDASLFTRRATSWLIGAFSTIALLLSMAGIYGVISYGVGQRSQEISIRMAMGAQKQQVLSHVLRQGMTLVVLGIVAGLGISIAGAGLVSGILVGVDSTEPLVYVGVSLLLLGVAGLANYLPARRAAALDPMTALRGE